MVANFINSWLRDITVLFIIVFIAELIMPKGNMKRYINLIIGLIIIIAIISPLVRLMNYDFNMDSTMANYARTEELNIDIENNFFSGQEDQIERLFKDKIKNQIIYLIEESWEYEVSNVYIEIEKEKNNDNNIKLIKIFLEDKSQEKQDTQEKDNISIEKIQKVEIHKKEEKNNSSSNINEPEEFNKIKKLIASSFSLDPKKIQINYKKER